MTTTTMQLAVCPGHRARDIDSACVRAFWATAVPAGLVFLLCIFSLPVPARLVKLLRPLGEPLCTYLTLDEAETLDSRASAGDAASRNGDASSPTKQPKVWLWRPLALVWIALLETLVWAAVGSLNLIQARSPINVIQPFVTAATWLYATIRPVARIKPAPPYDLFALYSVHLIVSLLGFLGMFYNSRVDGTPLPSELVLVAHVLNLVAAVVLVSIVLAMPVGVPSKHVDPTEIGVSVSPEDYTSVWGWVTLRWILPLVRRGTNHTLNENDVWSVSPTQQSRPLFIKFSNMKRATLLRRLWTASSFDLILDAMFTFVSVIFNYAGPLFLKLILDAIDHSSTESRAKAYVYAFLAFFCTIAKAQADVQHLWFNRRACTRTRSVLMASIYDKALKRRDSSGVTGRDRAEAQLKSGKMGSKTSPSAGEPKAGADAGKIVNLMAGDANAVAQAVSCVYLIYSVPFEIVIASVFLYQLLGWFAFAGLAVFIFCWPLNSAIARHSIRIQKGLGAARDQRMGVLNELIRAVKFIKFFAWEERWIQRVLDAREIEMMWMIKARMNSIMFTVLWSLAPTLVSVISFFAFVGEGNPLTVSIAFTSIALFNMIRRPISAIPSWIVQVLQAGVALNRIATYLDEDEVDEQVSMLKQTRSGLANTDSNTPKGFGIENGTFKWNEVEERKSDHQQDGKAPQLKNNSSDANENAEADENAETRSATVNIVSPSEAGDHHFKLHDISVMFPDGKLSVVTGPTASGKTALLMALLGELTILNGRVVMSKDPSNVDEHGLMHSISYAAQSPWLRHQSIKDNILFGYPYDEKRYNQVVECCALKPDLAMLEDGDETVIGARGVGLSGGQKARVALARAVYARTKFVLLDDPLSAVDTRKARLLYEKLLLGPLLAHRTVVLVTHHVELVLPGTYYLVRMLDGRIDTQGVVSELRKRGILDTIAHDSEIITLKRRQTVVAKEPSTKQLDPKAKVDRSAAEAARKLFKDEHRVTDPLKWHSYKNYLKASSYWTWAVLALIIVTIQVLAVTEKVWIKIWREAYISADASINTRGFGSSSSSEQVDGLFISQAITGVRATSSLHSLFLLPRAQDMPLFYIGIYAAIGLSIAVMDMLSTVIQYTGALRASRVLFRRLLGSVVHATMRWHDTTPQGQMLNRFSKDIETIDSSLASSLQKVNSSLATFAASVLTVTIVFPLFLIPAFIISLVYRKLAIGYVNTGRDLRRMESNARSLIFSDFSELVEGIVTVRAFSAEQRFLDGLHGRIDLAIKMWYNFWMTSRWLMLNFDVLGALAVLITTLFALLEFVSSGTAGLCITSAMAFTFNIYWTCRFWTELELDLNSVEHVIEYLDLPQAPPAIIESNRPPAYWPSSYSDNLIVVEDLVIKYAPELPPVLHNISFSLKGRERVGLLGRTGSGKSTVVMSILRFVDPTKGRIIIDGIDISTIGLHDLRSRITFIPQDATLFSGTIRENLDPFNEHDDVECLDVLHRVHILSNSAYQSQRTSRQASRASTRPTTPSPWEPDVHSPAPLSAVDPVTEIESQTTVSLDTQVSPGGANFSQGQRQLIAMARALLRRSSIIVLDEATSSIDFATDAKIQATIREEFGGSLLLTIVHRLKTVIDYDRLIVLDRGEIAQFDTPWNLIQKDGIFREMCLKSGMFTALELAAKSKAESKE